VGRISDNLNIRASITGFQNVPFSARKGGNTQAEFPDFDNVLNRALNEEFFSWGRFGEWSWLNSGNSGNFLPLLQKCSKSFKFTSIYKFKKEKLGPQVPRVLPRLPKGKNLLLFQTFPFSRGNSSGPLPKISGPNLMSDLSNQSLANSGKTSVFWDGERQLPKRGSMKIIVD